VVYWIIIPKPPRFGHHLWDTLACILRIHSLPSINGLEFVLHGEHLHESIRAAPQLICLTVHHIGSLSENLHLLHEFPHLCPLKIRDTNGCFSRDEFETLIKIRCLPSSHNQSQLSAHLHSPLECLEIVGPFPHRGSRSESSRIILWRKSSLIKDATRNETDGPNRRILS
jgi:hypothetical protein